MRLQLPKLTHKGWAVLGVCLGVPIAATVFLACSMAYTRKKAGGLLRDIQTLKVGESKIVDAHLLFKRYGGRFEKLTSPGYPGADDLDLFFSVQYKLLEEWLVARWKVRRFLSTQALPQSGGCCDLDFWRGLVAFIRIKGGRVTGSRVVIQVRRKDGFALLGNVEVVRVMPDSLVGRGRISPRRSGDICEQERKKKVHYIIRRDYYIECTCRYKGPALHGKCPKCCTD